MAPTPQPSKLDWRWLIGVWAIAVATMLVRQHLSGAGTAFFGDTDDAMRMVVVRDFLNGQGWYDLVQHRLNTPYGAEVHWSRLVDLPLAALWGGLTPLLGESTAMIVAGTVWPLLLLAVLLWLSARVVLELVGADGLLPALVLPVLSPAILAEFTPGRVDHHGVIIVLTLATLWASLVALRRPGFAWIAGLIIATALAIAIEAVPIAVAAILAFGLLYVLDAQRGSAMRAFGLAFGGGLALHLALARPPDRWLEAACDMLSPVYVLAGLLVGLALTLVSLIPAWSPWQRFGLLAVFGIGAGALTLAIYPQCAGGPYEALDPWLQTHWLAAITEAKPWFRSAFDLPPYTLAVGVPVFLGVAGSAIALWRATPRREGWLVTLVFALCSALVMVAQVRGARLAIMPAIPAAAWLIVRARQTYLAKARLLPALGLIATWLAFSGVVLALGVSATLKAMPAQRAEAVAAVRASKAPCLLPSAFADLKGLPPARIMTPIDLGSHMLLETHHEVVAAPYHRDADGVLDAFRFFNRSEADAHAIARKRGLTLLVTCPAMPEMRGVGARAEDSLVNRLANGSLPDWLDDVSGPGPLKVYAIHP